MGDPLSKLFKECHSMQNSGCHGNQKDLKKNIFLSKTGWISKLFGTDWSLGDPLRELFTLFSLVEKHDPQGVWPNSLCYYRNFVRETNLTNVVVLFVESFPPIFPLETRKSFVFWWIFSKDGIVHYVFSGVTGRLS